MSNNSNNNSILNSLQTISTTTIQKKDEIVDEVAKFFKDYIEGEDMIKYILDSITNSDKAKISRKGYVDVEAWFYHEGCSGTSIRVGNKYWKNPEADEFSNESQTYKGVSLLTIQYEIGTKLADMVCAKLRDEGLKIVAIENKKEGKDRNQYYYKRVIFTW